MTAPAFKETDIWMNSKDFFQDVQEYCRYTVHLRLVRSLCDPLTSLVSTGLAQNSELGLGDPERG